MDRDELLRVATEIFLRIKDGTFIGEFTPYAWATSEAALLIASVDEACPERDEPTPVYGVNAHSVREEGGRHLAWVDGHGWVAYTHLREVPEVKALVLRVNKVLKVWGGGGFDAMSSQGCEVMEELEKYASPFKELDKACSEPTALDKMEGLCASVQEDSAPYQYTIANKCGRLELAMAIPEVRALVDAAQRGIERGSFDQDRRVALMLAVNAFLEQDDV